MRGRLLTTLAVATAVAGGGVAAYAAAPNGEAAKAPTQIVADAQAASIAAKGVHIFGSGVSGGKPLKLDLYLVAGKGGRGSVTVNGLSFDIIRIGTTAYFRAGADFWRKFGGEAAAQLFKGKWLFASATTGDLASFTPLTDIPAFMKELLGSHGALKAGKATTIGNTPVVGVVDTAADGGTLYIATAGKPYPIAIAGKTGQKISFAGWNVRSRLVAPKGAIDYNQLTKKK